MRYQHPDGDDSPQITGIRGVFRAKPDEEGIFDVPDDVDTDVLEEHGYTPVGEKVDETDDTDPLAGWTEDDIVNADGNTIKSLASDFDDLDGRKAADPLREKLILKLRGE